jgi:peptidoglycan/LPS O-acetylase OafA/YrhL
VSATANPSETQTLWTLEAWRGLAAWMVVFAHCQGLFSSDVPMLRFTFTGVDLFFVLSGFVFAPYLFGRSLEVAPFAIRRFFRIYPAYFVALMVYAALRILAGQDLAYWWQHLLFLHLQSREMAFYYNPAFWSLPPEVEFYLALPVLAWICLKGQARFAALFAFALLARLWLGDQSDPSAANRAFIWMHHLPGMLLEFLFGAIAWRFSQHLKHDLTRLAVFAAGVVGWLALAGFFARFGDVGINAGWARGQMSWLAALTFSAMVAATAQPPREAPQTVINVALWAGRLSYGTYLLHIAALRLVEPYAKTVGGPLAAAMVCGLTLLGAWLLYQLWEDPCRKFGRRLAKQVAASKRPS